VSKSKKTENQNYSVDTQTRQYMQGVQNAALNAGMEGPSPLLTGAAQYGQGLQNAGATGAAALGGNQAAIGQLMNPYQQNVIDANAANWNKVNQQTMNAVNDRATLAGAFGGSRHGVATGVALGNNNAAQGAQTAALLQQGYGDTMNRAAQAAGLGLQGAGLNFGLGQAGVGSPNAYLLQMLRQGYLGPSGGTSGGAQSGTNLGINQIPIIGKFFGGG
jgi:hypothetical protein